MRVADYIMQRLADAKVGHLFMVTGRGVLYLSDAAARCSALKCVCVHHEQAGAYAAMAYAQYNGRIGACLVSTGCASTNAVTGVLCAWQDDVPMIVISGQNTLRETTYHTGLGIRTYGQQEANIVQIVKPITKYATTIVDPAQIAYEMDKALYLMEEGRKGPVWIDVPIDIQNMRVELSEMVRFIPPVISEHECENDVAAIVSELTVAERPVLFIGGGVRAANAEDEVVCLAERLMIPVVYDNGAVDVVRSDNDLSMGVVGTLAGNRAANFAIQNADYVIAIGERLSSIVVGGDPDKFARAAKVVAIGNDLAEFMKGTVRLHRAVGVSVKKFCTAMLARELPHTDKNWRMKCRHWRDVFPKCEERWRCGPTFDLHYVAQKISDHLPKNAIVVVDAGLEELIVPSVISYRGEQRCLQPVSQGAMGYAIPASYGAWLASGRPVVCVTGDGSAMMNLQEFQTISYNKFPLRIIVVNNGCYAVIRRRQQDLFRTRTVGTDSTNGVSCPDYSRVANCFGIRYERIDEAAGADEVLSRLMTIDGPIICEVVSNPDQTVLHSSFARTQSGRFVQRPIEDQSPYLDRDFFLREMVIKPIDQ